MLCTTAQNTKRFLALIDTSQLKPPTPDPQSLTALMYGEMGEFNANFNKPKEILLNFEEYVLAIIYSRNFKHISSATASCARNKTVLHSVQVAPKL